MEKLIELLNEYRTEKGEINLNEFEVSQTLDSLNYLRLFIKWLVDNDKIDKEFEDYKMLGDIFDSGYRFNDDYMEERLLCYLALSKEPISFLISILK